MDDEITVDRYGNPADGSRLIYCCFPDCGCNGSRLCMAENGPNSCSVQMNFEQGAQEYCRKVRDAPRGR